MTIALDQELPNFCNSSWQARLRYGAIKLLAGKSTILLNASISPEAISPREYYVLSVGKAEGVFMHNCKTSVVDGIGYTWIIRIEGIKK